MTLNELQEMLNAKKAELVELKAKIADCDEEAVTKGGELVDEIEALDTRIKDINKSKAMLKNIGSKEDKKDGTEVESGIKSLLSQAKSVNRSRKGWSISTQLKAATDVVRSVQIGAVDANVESSQPRVNRIADIFPQERIEDELANAVTVITENAVEGEAAIVAEGGKKPQISTSFTANTYPLLKIAATVKETDEIFKGQRRLSSVVEGDLARAVLKKENENVISVIRSLSTAADVTYVGDGTDANITTRNMMEAILKAKAQIENETDYEADTIFMNPADFFNMQIAKDSNGQYLAGGWSTGAYGNGSYTSAITPWGMRVIVNSNVTANAPFVVASDAVKIYRKDDIDVQVFDQNEDDAQYNLVMLRAEERLLPHLRNGKALVKVVLD